MLPATSHAMLLGFRTSWSAGTTTNSACDDRRERRGERVVQQTGADGGLTGVQPRGLDGDDDLPRARLRLRDLLDPQLVDVAVLLEPDRFHAVLLTLPSAPRADASSFELAPRGPGRVRSVRPTARPPRIA